MKKIYLTLLCGLMFATNTNAQTWNVGYPNAPDVIATLHNDTLTISGTGAMMNWEEFPNNPPWILLRENIRTAIIQYGVTTIGNRTFLACSQLTSVTIPNSVTIIRDGAFRYCTQLTSIIIPSSVTTIGSTAFENTGLISVTIPNSVTTIGNWAFDDSENLRTLILEDGSNNLALGRWVWTHLDTLHLGRNISLADGGFAFGLNLTYLIIGDSVTTIARGAFMSSRNLTSVTIPNSVTTIKDLAFSGSIGLTSVTIGSGVTSIGDWAFANSPNIRSISIEREIPLVINANVFDGLDKAQSCLYVPVGAIERYRTADVWGDFSCIREIGDQTNIVGGHDGQQQGSPLQVFPNPVSNELHITHDWQSGDVVGLFDMNGRRVFAEPICHLSIVNRQFTIDMSPFPNGNYILRIGNRVVQIVKQ